MSSLNIKRWPEYEKSRKILYRSFGKLQGLGVSERRACRALGQHLSKQRKVPQGRADEERLTDDIIELADKYGRYGYRMVTSLLNNAGWHVNHNRVKRIQILPN